jgi:hypothetical protein
VRGREAARRILELAALSETLDVRNRLRRLGMQVQGGGRDAQRMTFVEATIGECLDEAEVAASQRDRWLSCEAATWAVGWMARTRRAGGSAGSLLERLVRAAHAAATSLAAGDTLPACFVLTLARLFRDIEACRCLEESATVAVGAEVDRLVSAAGVVNLADSAAMVDRVVRWNDPDSVRTDAKDPQLAAALMALQGYVDMMEWPVVGDLSGDVGAGNDELRTNLEFRRKL